MTPALPQAPATALAACVPAPAPTSCAITVPCLPAAYPIPAAPRHGFGLIAAMVLSMLESIAAAAALTRAKAKASTLSTRADTNVPLRDFEFSKI